MSKVNKENFNKEAEPLVVLRAIKNLNDIEWGGVSFAHPKMKTC